MFKRVEPNQITGNPIRAVFPHCDPRVLHAPGECEDCDKHPDWQQLRQAWRIAFTGYEPEAEKHELPCPADFGRPGVHQRWPGNRARHATPGAVEEREGG